MAATRYQIRLSTYVLYVLSGELTMMARRHAIWVIAGCPGLPVANGQNIAKRGPARTERLSATSVGGPTLSIFL